jgi:hypothetical protein
MVMGKRVRVDKNEGGCVLGRYNQVVTMACEDGQEWGENKQGLDLSALSLDVRLRILYRVI